VFLAKNKLKELHSVALKSLKKTTTKKMYTFIQQGCIKMTKRLLHSYKKNSFYSSENPDKNVSGFLKNIRLDNCFHW